MHRDAYTPAAAGMWKQEPSPTPTPRWLPKHTHTYTHICCLPSCRRRHIQLQAGAHLPWQAAAATILADEGLKGFYRGFIPNTLKNLPNKGEVAASSAGSLGCTPNNRFP